MITDRMLAQAAAELADAINDSLPEPSECNHRFSARFERKMRRLIRRSNHPVLYRTLRSVASILLVIMIGFGTVLSVSAEARELVFGWVKQQYESFYEYFFKGELNSSESAKYYPGWMPDGCEFITSYEIPGGEVYVYTDEQECLIQFSYSSDTNNTKMYIESIDYSKHDVIINGCQGEVYIAPDKTETNGIVWVDKKNNILFCISADFNKDDLIKMAENIDIKK